MIIAITQRVIENQVYPETRDALSHDMFEYFSRILPGATLVPVPNSLNEPHEWARNLGISGLILSNGNDLGEAKRRDETESKLFRFCRDSAFPVLGICRGMQFINSELGGTITMNVPEVVHEQHVANNHNVNIVHEKIHQHLKTRSFVVNSYHNHGLLDNDLADELKPFAISDSGVIEGVVHKTEALIGLQWHPERANCTNNINEKIIVPLFDNVIYW